MRITHRQYFSILAAVFAVVWVLLAIRPWFREDWVLENVLVIPFVLAMGLSYRRFPMSKVSYTFIFVFLCLHEVGAHYTYAEVPYDHWFQSLFGFSLNEALGFSRNHFDRAIHFAYGLLLAYPIREVFLRVAQARGFWGYFLPLDVAMSTSLLFELIEWGGRRVFRRRSRYGLPRHPGRRLGCT